MAADPTIWRKHAASMLWQISCANLNDHETILAGLVCACRRSGIALAIHVFQASRLASPIRLWTWMAMQWRRCERRGPRLLHQEIAARSHQARLRPPHLAASFIWGLAGPRSKIAHPLWGKVLAPFHPHWSLLNLMLAPFGNRPRAHLSIPRPDPA